MPRSYPLPNVELFKFPDRRRLKAFLEREAVRGTADDIRPSHLSTAQDLAGEAQVRPVRGIGEFRPLGLEQLHESNDFGQPATWEAMQGRPDPLHPVRLIEPRLTSDAEGESL